MHGVNAFTESSTKEKSVPNSTSPSLNNTIPSVDDLSIVDAFGDEGALSEDTNSERLSKDNTNIVESDEVVGSESDKCEERTESVESEEEKQELIVMALNNGSVSNDLDEDEDEITVSDEVEGTDTDDINFTLKGKLGKQEVVPVVGIHDYSNMAPESDVDVDDLSEKLKKSADDETPNFTPERFRTDNAIDAEFREVTDAEFEDSEDLSKVTQNAEENAEKSLWNKAVDYYNYMDDHPVEALKKGFGYAGMIVGSLMRRHTFNKMKRSKQIFRQGDFDFVLRKDGSLVLLKYRGSNGRVIIPSNVGNKPVLYIHPDFLFSQTNPLDNYYTRGVVSKIAGVDEGALEGNGTITEIVLPESLLAISDKTFTGCATIKHLVIPASVRSIANNAFYGSGIKKLFFNGEIPDNFETDKFAGNIYVALDECEEGDE